MAKKNYTGKLKNSFQVTTLHQCGKAWKPSPATRPLPPSTEANQQLTEDLNSASSLRHTLYGIDPAFVHTALVPGLNPAMLLGPQPGINPGINPGTCLRSHRRHSGNFLAIFRDQRAVWMGLRFQKQKPGLTPHTHSDHPTTQPSTPSPSLPLLFLSL